MLAKATSGFKYLVGLVSVLDSLVSFYAFFILGAHHLTSPPSQADSLLAMFDPLSSGEGNLLSQQCHGSQWKSVKTSPIKSMLMSQALRNSLSPAKKK